ncbi:hypothetical protein EMPS_07541 [Entomortierella parvispora]|uniref:Eukaryotic translation initiation factor 2-alpha kinase 1 n=1 Tax=Entomortierella parvispora TaxID=205924 RepID=A0A9P3HF43_9FUNG|nr:hypothetical protein EMPS_07541 [Entomortierella parvispora]
MHKGMATNAPEKRPLGRSAPWSPRSSNNNNSNSTTTTTPTGTNPATRISLPGSSLNANCRQGPRGQDSFGSSNQIAMPDRTERRLTRNTTVMTLHSDSESDYEHSQGFDGEHHDALFSDSQSYNFDSGLTSILSGGSNIDLSHLSAGMQTARDAMSGSYRRFAFQGQGSSEEDEDEDDLTENTEDENGMDAAGMFNQDSDVNFTEEDEDSDDDDDDSENGAEHGASPRNSALGRYLLAPMGFDDNESTETATGVEGYGEAAERFQIFAGVNEFDESDQVGLDDHPYQVIPKSRKRDQERILESKRRQGKLLLVSLLDNFCLLYDQSPERNRKLFYVICKTLSNMGIIDEEYLEEMSAVRSSYQRAFRSLVLSALTSIKQEQMIMDSRRIMAPPSTPTDNQEDGKGRGIASQEHKFADSLSSTGMGPSSYLHTPGPSTASFPPPSAMMRTLSFGDMFDNDPTRYKHDFTEISKLGKGGFACVFKARNKLDGIEYAIKKIRLRGGVKVRYEKIFREIKFLARLDHKNVIRYYSSWLEHADYPVSKRELYGAQGGKNLESQGDYDDEYDDDEYGDEDEDTNTMSVQDESSAFDRPRRRSVDYFSPHAEQHAEHPEDLSMGIVFGEDEDDDNSNDISFDHSQGGYTSHHEADNDGKATERSLQGEDMERTHSASSTLTSRAIPGAAPRRKHLSPTVSQEMQGKPPTWVDRDSSSGPNKTPRDSSRHSLSNSFSALSSSIEEIQRSLPSSYSGSGLGSRYGHSTSGDRTQDLLHEENYELRPFSFPNVREVDRKNFAGGGIGGLHGMGASRNDRDQRKLRNSTGQLVTRDLTLFIQMQLCQTTLQDYLVFRNERPTALKRPRKEMNRRTSKTGKSRFGILSTEDDQTTHSTPSSPHEQTCHKDLVDPAANQHIFREIVEGVAYIHDQDMIHRDLKPSNIFLGMPAGTEHQRSIRQEMMAAMGQDMSPGTMTAPLSMMDSGDASMLYHGRSPSYMLTADDNCSPPIALTKEQVQEELFMNIETMVPKIGDFGLVTDMEGGATLDAESGSIQDSSVVPPSPGALSTASPTPMLRRHSSAVTTGSRSSRTRTTAVGTVTYASPEQLARPNLGYDQKADIYSLGIIFFELYHPFSTLMERHAVLKTLRHGELPTDFVSRWPKEAAFVLWLMAEDPRLRPSAREILEFDLIRKPKEETATSTAAATCSVTGAVHGSSPTGVTSMVTPTPASVSKGNGTSKNEELKSNGQAKRDMLGLGLMNAENLDSNINGCGALARILCEGCQVQCQCPRSVENSPITHVPVESTVTATEDDATRCDKSLASGSHPTHRRTSSKLKAGKDSPSPKMDYNQLAEQTEKVKRLEQSMAALRAENKALLDRIQELEFEKEQNAWKSH